MYITISSIFIFILILLLPIRLDVNNIRNYNLFRIRIFFFKIKLNYDKFITSNKKMDARYLFYIKDILKRIYVERFIVYKYHNINDSIYNNTSIKSMVSSFLHLNFKRVGYERYYLILGYRKDYDFMITLRIRIIDSLLIIWRIYGPKAKYIT